MPPTMQTWREKINSVALNRGNTYSSALEGLEKSPENDDDAQMRDVPIASGRCGAGKVQMGDVKLELRLGTLALARPCSPDAQYRMCATGNAALQ